MSITKPNYYAILTAEVRYDNRLSANEKLLFAEITALSNKTGECWASNSYFAGLYNKDNRTIRRWVSHLADLGYIDVALQYKPDSKEVDKRIITLGTKLSQEYGQNNPISGDENVLDNNTSSNNTSVIDERFAECWAMYGRKGNKARALAYWKKLSDKDKDSIQSKIIPYINSRDPQYRKDFQGWINPTYRMWEDELPQEKKEIRSIA